MTNYIDSNSLIPNSDVKFDDQIKVLRAYVVLFNKSSEDIHYKDVMKITRLNRTQVSGLHSFLVMLGLLEFSKRGYYIPTESVRKMCAGLPGTEDFAEIKSSVSESPLFKKVRDFFLVHGDSPKQDLTEFILDESGGTISSRVENAIEWLIRTRILEENEDEILVLS